VSQQLETWSHCVRGYASGLSWHCSASGGATRTFRGRRTGAQMLCASVIQRGPRRKGIAERSYRAPVIDLLRKDELPSLEEAD